MPDEMKEQADITAETLSAQLKTSRLHTQARLIIENIEGMILSGSTISPSVLSTYRQMIREQIELDASANSEQIAGVRVDVNCPDDSVYRGTMMGGVSTSNLGFPILAGSNPMGQNPAQPVLDDVELSLLVIDLNGQCLVRVEKQPEHELSLKWQIDENVYTVPFWQESYHTRLIEHGFPIVKSAIDQLGAESVKPVPRIELSSDIGEGLRTYRLYREYMGEELSEVFTQSQLDTLAVIFKHEIPLPIYTPKTGTWERLPNSNDVPQRDQLDAVWCRGFDDAVDKMPIEIWRYAK